MRRLIYIICVLALLTSCRTSREVATAPLPQVRSEQVRQAVATVDTVYVADTVRIAADGSTDRVRLIRRTSVRRDTMLVVRRDTVSVPVTVYKTAKKSAGSKISLFGWLAVALGAIIIVHKILKFIKLWK